MCVYVEERACLRSLPVVCACTMQSFSQALKSHLLSELLLLKDRPKKKKRKRLFSLQSSNPFVFAAAELTLAQSYLEKVEGICAIIQTIPSGFNNFPVYIS